MAGVTGSPREAFCDAIRPLGFGNKSTDPPEPFLPIADDVVGALRAGVTASDIGRALFDSDARPTWAQVKAFILAAITHLAPELEHAADGWELASPVTAGEALMRAMSGAVGIR